MTTATGLGGTWYILMAGALGGSNEPQTNQGPNNPESVSKIEAKPACPPKSARSKILDSPPTLGINFYLGPQKRR